ncbi:MAG: hypothetical protein KH449_09540 [Lachnospiraceae bacterium]|nr:hypothetical protein [Lachnospiraceae bacterium]
MVSKKSRSVVRVNKHRKLRNRLSGTAECPLAEKAIEKGIKDVVFDRGGFIYQGKVQALADAAREAGLNF